jgi:GNAT superfamily N-acetyltransferase
MEESVMEYRTNASVTADQIADLRQSVGWNRMENCYSDPRMSSYYHIACYEENKLVGYIDTVSNGLTDAYIQDLMVHPDYQGKGIGTALMNRVLQYLKDNRIYMISVVFEAKLLPFYSRFSFVDMRCGQMQTYESE